MFKERNGGTKEGRMGGVWVETYQKAMSLGEGWQTKVIEKWAGGEGKVATKQSRQWDRFFTHKGLKRWETPVKTAGRPWFSRKKRQCNKKKKKKWGGGS